MKTRMFAAGMLTVTAVLGVVALLSSSSSAQPPQWSWPEKSKNLKVLPADTDPQRLRGIMTGYTRALGVRCTHCHTGQEGQPLSTIDFASDENPKKNVARGMMKMVDSLRVQIAHIVPDAKDPVQVGCFTCHHGVARPRGLTDELALTYDASGADSSLARYRALRTQYYGSAAYDFGEGTLGTLARRAGEKKDTKGAVAIARANLEQFPQSGFVRAGLADALLAAGDTTQAIDALEESVKIDPRNERAARQLDGLKKRGK